jgi:hypothetical protein
MNLNDLANLGQIIGAIGVMITIVYLAVQIRGNTKVASAQARHAISEFVLRISIFRAEHADRFAKLESGAELTDGDRQFRYWSHVQFLLHAETYFHQHELGLMPDAHWRPYARYMTKYIQSPGFKEAWDDIGPGFSEDFARWLDVLLASPSRTGGRT